MSRKRKDGQPQRTVLNVKRPTTSSVSLPAPRRHTLQQESEVSDLDVSDSDAESQDAKVKPQSNHRPPTRHSTRQLRFAPTASAKKPRSPTRKDQSSLPALRATPARRRAQAEARHAARQKTASIPPKRRAAPRLTKKPPTPAHPRDKRRKKASQGDRKVKEEVAASDVEMEEAGRPTIRSTMTDVPTTSSDHRLSPEIPLPRPLTKRKISPELARLLGDQAEWTTSKKSRRSSDSIDEPTAGKEDNGGKERRASTRSGQRRAGEGKAGPERATRSGQTTPDATDDHSPVASCRTASPQASAETESTEDEKEEKWVAEQVLDYRLANEEHEAQVRIRWQGFQSDADSWEPLNNMQGLVAKISERLFRHNKVLVVKNGYLTIVDHDDVVSLRAGQQTEVAMTQTDGLQEGTLVSNVLVQTEVTATDDVEAQTDVAGGGVEVALQADFMEEKLLADAQVQTQSEDQVPLHHVEVQCDPMENQVPAAQMMIIKQEEEGQRDMAPVENASANQDHQEAPVPPRYPHYRLVSPLADGNETKLVFRRKVVPSMASVPDERQRDEEVEGGEGEEVEWSSLEADDVSIVGHVDQEGGGRGDWLYQVVIRRAGPLQGSQRLLTLAKCLRYFEQPLQAYISQVEERLRARQLAAAGSDSHSNTTLEQVQRVRTAIDVLAQLCTDPQGFTIVQKILKNTGPQQIALLDDPRVKTILLRIVEHNNKEDDEEEEEV